MVWVIKLGGSLFEAAELRAWLTALAEVGVGRVVIVPGGGPFADQVRSTQRRWNFDDATAHRMAVLAMEQYGLMLAGLEPRLWPAAGLECLRQGLSEGRAVLWLPVRMVVEYPELPAAWELTSDSLALWLAGKLGARACVLVKSAVLEERPYSLQELVALDIVDRAFPGMLKRIRCPVFVAGRKDHVRLAQGLDVGDWPIALRA